MQKSLSEILKQPIPVDENMNIADFENDPYFVKKNEKAAKIIAKYGIPESFKDKNRKTKSKDKKLK